MKVTLISKENNVAVFEMEFSGEEFMNAIESAYQTNKKNFVIDGFRRGKAPRSIIEKRYGQNVFEDEAINELFSNNYVDAITELKLKVINSPQAEFNTISREEGIKVKISVEVYPEVEVKDYKGVEIEKISTRVLKKDVDDAMLALQKRNARMETVDRAVKEGDHIIFDFEGTIDGEKFDGGSAERYSLEIGSGQFIPGFEEQLIGVKSGDVKNVEVTFPEDYGSKELAGKDAVFKCTIHEVKEEELPELDDEFAKDVSEYDTLEELKEETKEKLKEEKRTKAENRMKDAALKAVYEANDIEIPRPLVEDELDTMIENFKTQLEQQGLSFKDYLKYLDKKEKELRDDMREEASRNVKTRMLVGAVVDKENITVSDEELEEQLAEMAKQYNMEVEPMKEMMGEDSIAYIRSDMEMQKAVTFIYENAEKVSPSK